MFLNKKIVCILFLLFCFVLSSPSFSESTIFYETEVVVTASRALQLKSESPASISIITAEDIKNIGAENVGDVLRFIPSAHIKSYGPLGASSSVTLRGSTSEQVLVLIDGIRMNSPQDGQVDLSTFLIDDVEKIEVVRGPASALYGADAVGGVINIITKQGGIPKTNLSLSLGNFGERKTIFARSGLLASLNYFLSVSNAQSDGYRANSDYSAQKYIFKLSQKLGKKTDLTFSSSHYQGEHGNPGSLSRPSLADEAKERKTNLSFVMDSKISSKSQLKIKAFQNYNDNEILDGATWFRHKTWVNALELQQNIQLERNDFVYGFETRGDRIDSTSNGDHQISNLAFFLNNQTTLSEITSILVGGRVDKHSVFGSQISPRIGMALHPASDITLRTSWGRAFRAPNFNDLYWPKTYMGEGNPNLNPEISESFDIGLDRKLGPSSMLTLSLFTSSVKDKIDWAPGNDGVWRPSNVSAAKLEGAEIELKRKFSKWVEAFVNYTYLKAIDANTQKELTYKPNDSYNLGFSSLIGVFENNVQVSHIGKRYINNANTQSLPPYTVANFNTSTKLGTLSFNFGIQNMFNEQYEEQADYPMPGRKYTFGVKTDL